MKSATTINFLVKRNIVTAVLISASIAAFATLGDGGKKSGPGTFLPSAAYTSGYKPFSLKTNFNYRGNNILNSSGERFIMLNTVITYQKGHNTYILPLKKKVILDRVKFNLAQ